MKLAARFLPLALLMVVPVVAATMNTGDQLTVTYDLQYYQSFCSFPGRACDPFPYGLTPFIHDIPALLPVDQYSLFASLRSLHNGVTYAIGNLDFFLIPNPGPPMGRFWYQGTADFPFPSDPTFFSPDPTQPQYQIIFLNTGAAFTMPDRVGDFPPIYSNLDVRYTDGQFARTTNSDLGVEISRVPEPGTLLFSAVALCCLCLFRVSSWEK